MRKLKLQMQLTIDGFVARPNGEMDWMTWNWDDALKDFVTALHKPVDCILLGRKMTGGFVDYWKAVAANPEDPQYPFGKLMYEKSKVAFSKTLKESTWDNTVLATGDITEEINRLKKHDGGDIIVYGGANFVSGLIKHNLIDEYYLFINPVAIGSGLTIFKEIEQKFDLKLVNATRYDCGIVVLNYVYV